MKCKICGLIESNEPGNVCKQCAIAIGALDTFLEDLKVYLASADSSRLPDYYSKNLPYFVSTLSIYNRYVSIKNLVQEITTLYLSNDPDETIFFQDVENSDPLKSEKIVNFLSSSGLLSLAYENSISDYKIVPKEKISISQYVLINFGLGSPELSDYFNSLLLYSMLEIVMGDITSWINGSEKAFPRKGFFPIRLIAGPIIRSMNSVTDGHHITSNEILRALRGLTYKNQTKAWSQMMGIDFQSKNIFEHIPDPDVDAPINLTEEFSEIIDHLAERIRERTKSRENIR
jgi:hypothetical protein